MRRVGLIPVVSVVLTLTVIITWLPTALAEKAANELLFEVPLTSDVVVEPGKPVQRSFRAAKESEPPRNLDIRGDEDWLARYQLWQESMTYSSSVGPLAHGRRDVLLNGELIRRWAPPHLSLLVAASIAHQGSDVKDRPFGTDIVEEFWRENVDPNASVGIAQLRPEEVVYWAPGLIGDDLLAPEVAVRVMTGKLSKASQYMDRMYDPVSLTDRMMLLALVQNTSTEVAMHRTIDFFFHNSARDWQRMLASEQAKTLDWREQLRLVFVHATWLATDGWEQPEGLNWRYWSQIAFSE